MNKILVESDNTVLNKEKYEFTKDDTLYLDVSPSLKKVDLVVLENVKMVINLLGKTVNTCINIHIHKNASLTLNYLLLDSNSNIKIDLDEEKSEFILNYSVLSNVNSHNQIIVNHNASKTTAVLKNHAFSKNCANIILDVSAYIGKKMNKCISKQDNQIIENENSLSQINPNLYIENYDIDASHAAYVGEFKEAELFYLMSRGLTEESSKLLLLKSFLIGSFNLDENKQEEYYQEVIKYLNKEV